MTVLFISPHLDDAVLSCGITIYHSEPENPPIVLTVFGGVPKGGKASEWDRKCGLRGAKQGTLKRKEQDIKAVETLGAIPVHLGFVPPSYASRPPSKKAVAEAIRKKIKEFKPKEVFFPLGLEHKDHILVADACWMVMKEFPSISVWVYEDQPYRVKIATRDERLWEIEDRLDLRTQRFSEDTMGHEGLDAKLAALRCYGKQITQLSRNYRGWRALDYKVGEIFYPRG